MHITRSSARRWQIAGVGAVAVALVGVGLGVASAAESSTPTVNCPAVAGALGAIPAQSQAEIERNLALLNTQIAEANKRLATSANEGGANFVQNAILGPLKDKRVSTIDRMVISIGRHATAPQLDEDALATCTLNEDGGDVAPAEPTAVATSEAEGDAAASISCPEVESELGTIPAQAQDEIDRNLALLDTQIAEANKRLATSANEGGANFVQNAILGPLKDKRVATINRMATAIGRNAEKPVLDVESLATCSLGAESEPAESEPAESEPAESEPAESEPATSAPATSAPAAALTVNCPDIVGLPSIPAEAQEEVARNLTLLQTQIDEANKRLSTSANEGGPNFIQNAILGPLEDKRFATLNRIETAIGRHAAKPEGLEQFAACSLND